MYAVNFANTLTGWLGRALIQNLLYVINLVTFSTLALRDWFNKNKLFKSRNNSTTSLMALRYFNQTLPGFTLLFRSLLITGLITGSFTGPVTADEKWQFEITPVIWNASVDVNFSDENSGGGVPINPDYSFFTLENLDSYLSLKAEANHGRYGLLFDSLKARYEDETTNSPVYFSVGTELGFIELSARYQVSDRYKVDLIAGARQAFLDIDTTLPVLQRPGRMETRSYDWLDPILGLRYLHSFNQKWATKLRGDFGIFDTGSDKTLQLSADMLYQMNKRISVLIGYRYLYIKFTEEDLLYDVALDGLQLGLGIHF